MQNILDVTIIDSKLKHPTIFQAFDKLAIGEEFIIHNDHDPKPLYYELIGERGNVFEWKYIESGPDFWKVKISKKSINQAEPSIGDLVARDFRKAEILKKHNIDFCCGGRKTISQVCEEKNLNLTAIQNELNLIPTTAINNLDDFDSLSLELLVDYIVDNHHNYVKNSIPIIIEYTKKVSRVHGQRHPEVVVIADLFFKVTIELHDHILKEENILFPYIKAIFNSNDNKTIASKIKAITVMEQEHEMVGNLLKEIRSLSNNYTPPVDACTTFKLSYLKLKEFEEDLHSHIHLENNILFPKTIALEIQISALQQ